MNEEAKESGARRRVGLKVETYYGNRLEAFSRGVSKYREGIPSVASI